MKNIIISRQQRLFIQLWMAGAKWYPAGIIIIGFEIPRAEYFKLPTAEKIIKNWSNDEAD